MLSSDRLHPASNLTTPHSLAQGTTPNDAQHIHPRLFIGPMPDKVVSQIQLHGHNNKKRGWFQASVTPTSEELDASMSRAIKHHAFKFFIHQGGKAEDWDENEERGVIEEMLQRWEDSEWGKVWYHRKEKVPSGHWVGDTFPIGSFLGVSLMSEGPLSRDRPSSRNSLLPTDNQSITPTSSTGLLRPSIGPHDSSPPSKTQTESARRPAFKMTSSSAAKSDGFLNANGSPSPSSSPQKDKGKRKLVHYADVPFQECPAPVPPSEVRERQGSAVEDTSADATVASAGSESDTQWGDVVMRDRMLVRFSHARSESLGSSFDEAQNRTTRHLRSEPWAEFMVVWRKDFIELYDDWGMPAKEWFTGHKHLAFVVPLKTSATRLSLYSFVDLTFCFTCPPTSTHRINSKARSIFNRKRDGTDIFVFKVKSRTRAIDWIYQLWRHLGGQIPPSIEIRNPRLDTRVKIDIPNYSPLGVMHEMFSRSNVLALCTKSLRSVSGWDSLIQRRVAEGETLQLAWRMDTYLDWIWQENDVDGKQRDWAVLAGIALKQGGKVPHLEIRMSEHFPSSVHLQSGRRLPEPPGIEGYLDRIKPNSQTKQEVYLSTQDGNLFSLTRTHAHPPAPPGIHPHVDGDATTTLRRREVMRGAAQVMDAAGVIDLRSILTVRRAFHVVPQNLHQETNKTRQSQKQDDWVGIWTQTQPERAGSDDEDVGGDEGLAKADDKPKLKMKRSFELLLKSGRIIRFEAHSRRVALEWIEHLRALIYYWERRHVLDAREEMDLAQALRPRLTPHIHAHQSEDEVPPEPPVDPRAYFPALGSMHNWCVLDGCKAILRGGKVFVRRLYGQYELKQLILVSGQLVQFHVTPNSSLHHRRSENLNLMDAYVCSGYFAALSLPTGQYNPNVPAVPRRYQDGLEADDPEEDMLFMVWYPAQVPATDQQRGEDVAELQAASIPTLSAKRKTMVFRTRSKLERDSWCWAINCEIERIVRQSRLREEKLRETGGLVKL